jgi:hypothetical protein
MKRNVGSAHRWGALYYAVAVIGEPMRLALHLVVDRCSPLVQGESPEASLQLIREHCYTVARADALR